MRDRLEWKDEGRRMTRDTRHESDVTLSLFAKVCSEAPWCRRDVFDAVVELAIEIAREGREGRRVGTLFTLGHADAVLAASRPPSWIH